MKNVCAELHTLAATLPRIAPSDRALIPLDGIYLVFEKGEEAHGVERIVRVGTHTGAGQLPSRLAQHMLASNKDRSIFRKQIGRALIKRDDVELSEWEIDYTPASVLRPSHARRAAIERMEECISSYMRDHFTFAVIPVGEKADRLVLESRIVSTLSRCAECEPSSEWLGRHSPIEKIRRSGLWQVNELWKEPLSAGEFAHLASLARG